MPKPGIEPGTFRSSVSKYFLAAIRVTLNSYSYSNQVSPSFSYASWMSCNPKISVWRQSICSHCSHSFSNSACFFLRRAHTHSRTQQENSARTKIQDNVHFRRKPFQSTMTTTTYKHRYKDIVNGKHTIYDAVLGC